MNVYLIGMPGVGKTTLGKELATRLKCDFIDTDELIKTKTDETIAELLKKESGFRKIESEVIAEIKGISNTVVSLGGGAILNSNNINNLYGLVIYLYAPLSILKHRVDVTTRPIFEGTSLEKIYNDRVELYDKYCDYKVDNNELSTTINEIVKIINQPKKNILVVNGPNLNMLGKRDEELYGNKTLTQINDLMKKYDVFNYTFFQSNSEGAIIDTIHTLEKYDGLIINPAAYTHTSIAIGDALEIFDKPKVEVHLSDVNNREKYRKTNYITPVCDAKFDKKHEFSYLDAINYLKKLNL